ncbi:MAG: hypothetical protein IJE09_02135 [Oscillospiraceae bacterium]|nr:hypothetical protein [Oscillospiraceae bacterium]
MLIAAAAKGAGLDALIPEKYEDSSHLLIVETDTMEIISCHEKKDELGADFVKPMADSWCEAIVCGKIPREIFTLIADNGISRYNGAGLSAAEGLKGAEDNSLPMMVKE